MCSVPQFQNIFPRALIPVASGDAAGLAEIYASVGESAHREFTCWLIALQWEEDETGHGWKVIVYPVSEKRAFWLTPPFYHSPEFVTFDQAWLLSESIRELALNGRLASTFVSNGRSNRTAI